MMLTPKKEAQGETTATRVNDPVCGMKVDPEKTDYKYVYKGTPYFFCRKQCLDTFEKDPERYLRKQPEMPPPILSPHLPQSTPVQCILR